MSRESVRVTRATPSRWAMSGWCSAPSAGFAGATCFGGRFGRGAKPPSEFTRWVKIGFPNAILAAVLSWGAVASADLTGKLPAPDVRGLLQLAAMPLDKPPVPLPAVAMPPAPQTLPELPPPRFMTPVERPRAPLPPPRTLACNPIGTVFGVASELLECGRARYQRDELEDARAALQKSIQESSDRRVLREARYWLAETLVRLDKTPEVERLFLLVVQDDPRSEFGLYAADALGWVALESGDPRRALDYFDGVLKLPAPPVLAAYARHGRAMALYGLKRYAEARDQWATLLNVGGFSTPNALVPEATFWFGETLGRLGEYKGAVSRLQPSSTGNPMRLRETGLLRLGWWSRQAGQPNEAVNAYRTLLGAYPSTSEGPWARAGLVQALLDLDDFSTAREEARRLEALDKGGLALPTWLLIRKWLADKSRPEDARALDDELLARTLSPANRAWVLLLSADLARQSGQADEARNRLELVRQAPAVPLFGFQAALALAHLDFDTREFARAEEGAKGLLNEALPEDVRAKALLLAGEAAYWARDYSDAAGFYSRFLTDMPKHPAAPHVGLALGWAEFRRGHLDAARQRWAAFASEVPSDPRAAEALLLSAELAAKAGDVASAQRLFAEVITRFANTPQAQVAILNRAVLAINGGRPADALPELALLAERAPMSPYIGRVRLAKGIALLSMGRLAEAPTEFQAALGQGEDAMSHLGLGVLAFERGNWDVAVREFDGARDTGTAEVGALAEYGRAAAAFNQRKIDEFKQLATALVARPSDPRITPNILYGMSAVAAEEKRWPEARDLALRATKEFPRHAVAAAALADVGTAAGADRQWPLAREMFETLAKNHPTHPGNVAGRLVYAESLLRTGAAPEARRELETFVKASPRDPAIRRALVLLAEAQEASGNRAAAIDLYTRLDRDYPDSRNDPSNLLKAARLLQADGRWSDARSLLERMLNQSDPKVVAESGYRLGEGFQAAGQYEDAIEAYMTVAYLAPDSEWARRALLAAGQSFATLKQNESAAIVYKKLLAASGVEPDLAATARSQLKELGVP
ncbi:MAG: hypothetical protein C5B48_14740 [Candidatus Rokuibacteriota bacterium]|nr:MAG: hypothetical protein C5B48_14740 [Candidatus Rokubacteria bacterium]